MRNDHCGESWSNLAALGRKGPPRLGYLGNVWSICGVWSRSLCKVELVVRGNHARHVEIAEKFIESGELQDES